MKTLDQYITEITMPDLSEQRLHKWYIPDFHPGYETGKSLMAQIIKEIGGTDIHYEPKWGWSNQTNVIVFQSTIQQKKEIDAEMHKRFPKVFVDVRNYYHDWQEANPPEEEDE